MDYYDGLDFRLGDHTKFYLELSEDDPSNADLLFEHAVEHLNKCVGQKGVGAHLFLVRRSGRADRGSVGHWLYTDSGYPMLVAVVCAAIHIAEEEGDPVMAIGLYLEAIARALKGEDVEPFPAVVLTIETPTVHRVQSFWVEFDEERRVLRFDPRGRQTPAGATPLSFFSTAVQLERLLVPPGAPH